LPATVHWTFDDWKTANDSETTETAIGLFYGDLPAAKLKPGSKIIFTFRWKEKWDGHDFTAEIV
jgi:hypothetical protein